MKLVSLLVSVFALATLLPVAATANSGDFAGPVAIGTGYAGIVTAPPDTLLVQQGIGIGTTNPFGLLDLNGAIADLQLNRTTGTADSIIRFLQSNVVKSYIGIAGATNGTLIAGSTAGDTGIRNEGGNILFLLTVVQAQASSSKVMAVWVLEQRVRAGAHCSM